MYTADCRGHLLTALGNLGAMLAVIFGGERIKYLQAMEPMCTWLLNWETKMAADSFVCFRIHLALERVFKRMREEKAKGPEPDQSMLTTDALVRELAFEFVAARGKMPAKDVTSGPIISWLADGYEKVVFRKPGGGGGDSSTERCGRDG